MAGDQRPAGHGRRGFTEGDDVNPGTARYQMPSTPGLDGITGTGERRRALHRRRMQASQQGTGIADHARRDRGGQRGPPAFEMALPRSLYASADICRNGVAT